MFYGFGFILSLSSRSVHPVTSICGLYLSISQQFTFILTVSMILSLDLHIGFPGFFSQCMLRVMVHGFVRGENSFRRQTSVAHGNGHGLTIKFHSLQQLTKLQGAEKKSAVDVRCFGLRAVSLSQS